MSESHGSRLGIGTLAGLCAVSALIVVSPSGAWAGGTLELGLGNDLGSGNAFVDDHYTATFRMRYERSAFYVHLEERMFTDRASGSRFDESHAAFRVALPRLHEWSSSFQLGVVHLGQGIFGERMQNGLHRLLKNRLVDLSYPIQNKLLPTAQYEVGRDVVLRPTLALAPRFHAFTAPEFRSYAHASMGIVWSPTTAFELRGAPGLRVDRTRFAPLEAWVGGMGMSFALEATLWQSLVLSWTHNEFGLAERHFNLAVRIPTP